MIPILNILMGMLQRLRGKKHRRKHLRYKCRRIRSYATADGQRDAPFVFPFRIFTGRNGFQVSLKERTVCLNQQKGIKRFFADFKKFFPLLLNLAGKDFKLKYRRSILGVLWSILNPLLTMIIITRVFGILLKVQVENFATYYLLGYTLWTFFSESTTNSMSSIVSDEDFGIRVQYITC